MNLELHPADQPSWDGGARTKVLLIAVNVDGYYSAPIRLLALICACSQRLSSRFDARFVESTAEAIPDELTDRVVEWAPAIIGFSMNIWNRDQVLALAKDVKSRMGQVCILVGGQEVTGSSIDYLAQAPQLDYLIDGEGEIPFQQFLDQWDADSGRLHYPEKVTGLRYRDDGAPVYTGPAQCVQDLDELPSVVLAGLVPLDEKQKLGVLLEGARCCPFRCAFCFEGAKKGSLRTASLGRLIEEIDFMVGRGATYFHIMDPILCVNDTRRLQALTNHIASLSVANRNVIFSVETYAEYITEEVARCLKNCAIIDVGLQTIHEPTLKAINRRHVPEKFQAGLQRLRQVSASFNLYLICGLPYETLASYLQGLRFVLENHPTRLFLNELCLLNGTALRRKAADYGYVYDPDPPYQIRETAWLTPFELNMAHVVSKVVEKHYNLSAEGIFVKYPWLPERPVAQGKYFTIEVAGGCSFGCGGCRAPAGDQSSGRHDDDWDRFFGADVDIFAGDGSAPDDIIQTAGRLRLSGVARVGLVAPARLLGDAAFIARMIEGGIWCFRTFFAPCFPPGSPGSAISDKTKSKSHTADVYAAVSNLNRSFQLKGRAVIHPFVEVVIYTAGLSRIELEDHLAAFTDQYVSIVTVLPSFQNSDPAAHSALAAVFKQQLGSRTWIRMPEAAMVEVLKDVRQSEEVMAHLKHLDMVYSATSGTPPCFRPPNTDGEHS